MKRSVRRSRVHFGTTISTAQANYNGNYVFGNGTKGQFRARPMPVGSFAANAWGLHDMHGNVHQWCEDWYDANEYNRGDCKDPKGPNTGTSRVVRGGSWGYCRSAFRYYYSPDYRNLDVGFRVVLSSR